MTRIIFLFSLITCGLTIFSTIPVNARQSEMEKFQQKEFLAFKEKSTTDFQGFRSKQDLEFANFLTEQWKGMREMSGLVADKSPKPKVLPKATDKPKDVIKPADKTVTIVIPPTIDPPQVKPTPVTLIPPPPEPVPTVIPTPPKSKSPETLPKKTSLSAPLAQDVVRLEFFGATFDVTVKESLRLQPQLPHSDKSLVQAWSHIAQADHAELLRRLEELRVELQLNDWGYYQLVQQLARAATKEEQGATVLTWFVLVKSGYRCRLGYSGEELCLLVAVNETIYGTSYFSVGNERFYNLSRLRKKTRADSSLYIYEKDHPAATKRFEMQLRQTPLLPLVREDRQLTFKYAGRNHQIPAQYNRNMTNFFAGYPQTDFPVFFGAGVDPEVATSLLDGLRPLLSGMKETEAVNLILRFVQTAFDYKTDDEQFGREKYFFPSETLAYPFSDCEDRSILFAFLVKKLIGLPVVGLHYPGHMSTAVNFSGEVTGDTLLIDGHRYTICDPTYINADIGQAMPQHAQLKPIIVLVDL